MRCLAGRAARAHVGVALVVTLAACGGPGEDSATPVASGLVAEAREAGADESQLEILADGQVTYTEYEQAMNRAFACLRERDFDVDVKGTRPFNGVTVLDYQVQGTTDATNLDDPTARERMLECELRYSDAVNSFWQVMSPDAVAFIERRDAALAPGLAACLGEHDVDVPDDATMHELVLASVDLTTRDESVDCLLEIGYDEWDG